MSQNPFRCFDAEVVAVEDLGPSFRRVTFSGPGMERFGLDGHPRDLRIKLIIPPGDAPVLDLPRFLDEQEAAGTPWYSAWREIDESVRGTMRTYTVREWRDEERELVIDMVLHTDEDGNGGPASVWATRARPGSRLQLIGRDRDAPPAAGGMEFDPGEATDLLLAGDETAVPAIASILDHLADQDVRGRAVLEVPDPDDVQTLRAPEGIEVTWLPRGDRPVGSLLDPAVREAVPAAAGTSSDSGELEDVDVDADILWDTPHLSHAASRSGSEVDSDARPFYAWIAGEAAVVKGLRRYLVRDLGVDRRQVAFMGYWRLGRAEPS